MTDLGSPTIARRRVRLALREARETAALTQQQVADEMEWSLSKVARIENGGVSIAPNDLRPLLSLVGIVERTRVAALMEDARVARLRLPAWHQAPGLREHLTDAFRSLVEYEAEAVAIRYYSIYFIPAVLQTDAYAKAQIALLGAESPRAEIEARLSARKRRREALMSRPDRPRLLALLDESVLRRPIGGAAVFAAQLRQLSSLALRGTVEVRMIPFSLDAPVTNNASFDLLSLNTTRENMVLYRESGLADELIEDGPTTLRHRARFDKVWSEAISEKATADFLNRQAESQAHPTAPGR